MAAIVVWIALVNLMFLQEDYQANAVAPQTPQIKNAQTYHTTYVPDPHESEFKDHTDTYDPKTHTRKVTNRKKKWRKVKKLKENKSFVNSSKKVNWI